MYLRGCQFWVSICDIDFYRQQPSENQEAVHLANLGLIRSKKIFCHWYMRQTIAKNWLYNCIAKVQKDNYNIIEGKKKSDFPIYEIIFQ